MTEDKLKRLQALAEAQLEVTAYAADWEIYVEGVTDLAHVLGNGNLSELTAMLWGLFNEREGL